MTAAAAARKLVASSSSRRLIGDTASIELSSLLDASGTAAREAAWDALIGRHTRLLIAVARCFGGSHDEVMDRYTYVLEKLREKDFHRLTVFQADGRAAT